MKNYEYQVLLKIEKKPELKPVFTNTYDIPRRIKDYDSSFFVVFNTKKQRFEIHSLEYPEGQTLSCTIPYTELDERAIQHLWKNDIRVHGKEIFRRLEANEEKARTRKEKELKDFNRDFAIEHRSAFAKDAWS